MMTTKTPLLSVRNMSSSYGPIQALCDVSFDVMPGEAVTLLGSNGAGKTTTLMCVSGIQPLNRGEIVFDGVNITLVPAHERLRLGLAQVPEGRRIFPRLTVNDNLRLGAYSRSDEAEIRASEEHVYSLFPILRRRSNQLGGTLSGGEQQMLAIGRALMSKPRMLLLDEPSMGIAPLLVRKIFETLERLNQEGMTILLIEQNAHLALKLATRGYVLETGSVTISGESSRLISDPRVREAYLGA
jgi:branched-chain amino acid transport system ATP-binding protein